MFLYLPGRAPSAARSPAIGKDEMSQSDMGETYAGWAAPCGGRHVLYVLMSTSRGVRRRSAVCGRRGYRQSKKSSPHRRMLNASASLQNSVIQSNSNMRLYNISLGDRLLCGTKSGLIMQSKRDKTHELKTRPEGTLNEEPVPLNDV